MWPVTPLSWKLMISSLREVEYIKMKGGWVKYSQIHNVQIKSLANMQRKPEK